MRFSLRAFTFISLLLCFDLTLIYMHVMRKRQQNGDHSLPTYLTLSKHFPSTLDTYNSHNVLYFTNNIFDISAIETESMTKLILIFNAPEYMKSYARKDVVYKDCEYKHCIISYNKSKLLIADAVIFYIGVRNKRMGKDPPITTKQRNSDQIWIFASAEPPEHFYNTDYTSKTWHHTMNWSSLYRLDSDIPNPYGCLIRAKAFNSIDYASIYNEKTRNALWVVSHCQVASARRRYVTEMIRNGFPVDILGGCSSDGRKVSSSEIEQIIPTYKYILAFENSFCTDYISEKFFQNYNFSSIIVVRGGANYKRLLPENTYINTADFSNISTLVDYLLNLANDKETYIEFLRNKDMYISIRWPGNRNCEICRRLNNVSKYRKTYKTLDRYLTHKQCFTPNDLSFEL